jgi:hypothetical protein
MFCQACGAQSEESFSYCQRCGRLLSVAPKPDEPVLVAMPYPPPPGGPVVPAPRDQQVYRGHVESYMSWSVLSSLLCCPPVGVVAIVFSARVGSRLKAGDYEGAVAASKTARRVAIGALIAGIAFEVIGVLAGLGIGGML